MSFECYNTAAAVPPGPGNDWDIRSVPATIVADGLAAGEAITLKTTLDDGATWIDVTESAGTIQLTADDNARSIYAPMRLAFDKPATAGAVRVRVMDSVGD